MENELLVKILETVEQFGHELKSLNIKVSSLDQKVDLQYATIITTLNRIELSQQEDVISILNLINTKLEDTAKKSDFDSLRGDIEFVVKENSLFTLELDRLKRTNYND